MHNFKLMKKIIELDTQKLTSRKQSQKVMVQIAIIRKAFGVKNAETFMPVKDFEREIILSDEEITKKFNEYVSLWKLAIDTNDKKKEVEYRNAVEYFIEGVHFFNVKLSEKFRNEFLKNSNKIK